MNRIHRTIYEAVRPDRDPDGMLHPAIIEFLLENSGIARNASISIEQAVEDTQVNIGRLASEPDTQ